LAKALVTKDQQILRNSMQQNKLQQSNEMIITLSEFQGVWKEVFVSNLNVLFPPRAKENEKYWQSRSGVLVD
jgi:hypothetical protein